MAEPRSRAATRRPLPWWGVVLVVVAVLGLAELGARAIGPNIDRTAGSEERALVKADQIYDRGGATGVVFLGSSETGAGLVVDRVLAEAPALDGGYNAALVGATPEISREWAERVVLPQLDPDVVVIGLLPSAVLDTSDLDVDTEVAEATDDAYRSAFDQIDPGGLGSIGWELRQHSALIRYRPHLRSPSTTWDALVTTVTGGRDEPDLPDDGTVVDVRTETDPEVVAALTAPDGEILEYRGESVEGLGNDAAVAAFTAAGSLPVDRSALEALVEAVRDAGATPVLALAPVDRTVLEDEGADLSGLDQVAADLEAWAEEEGVLLHSVYDESWPAEWFNDRQHVDDRGATAWSEAFGGWLQERCEAGDLPCG